MKTSGPIDVQDLMEQIELQAKEMRHDRKGYTQINKPDDHYESGSGVVGLTELHSMWNLPFNLPLPPYKGFIGTLKHFFKRLVRKSIFWYVRAPFQQQTEFNAYVVRTVDTLEKTIRAQHKDIELQGETIRRQSQDILSLEKLVSGLGERIRILETQDQITLDYLGFENKYRGSTELISKRNEAYVDLFSGRRKVLDLGCGRGEMLELLSNCGVDALGVDMNEELVQQCRDKGLNVVVGDLIEFLEHCEAASLDGIFVGQVLEHLTNQQMEQLLRASEKKLIPGGLLVLESPNPRTLSVFAQAYFLDPTHRHLKHPFTVKYLLEEYGFGDVRIEYRHPMPEEYFVSHFIEDNNIKSVAERWEQFLFGPQDYSIVAVK